MVKKLSEETRIQSQLILDRLRNRVEGYLASDRSELKALTYHHLALFVHPSELNEEPY
jgi:hypothetical protein